MKKLMTAFAACFFAGLVTADPVTSQNIVGYQTLAAPGQFYSTGSTFISVGSATGEWTLGDVTAVGMDPTSDFIQFLSVDDANTELSATYIDAATADLLGDPGLVGWWDLAIENPLNDQAFGAGTGFLSFFVTPGISLTYSGEVLDGDVTLDLSGQLFPMVSNPLPVDLTLGDITASGMDPTQDFIQFLNTDTANTDVSATYIDAATADILGDPGLVGWWDLAIENSLNTQSVPAGSAFLGSFVSPSISITFPDAIN